MRAEGYTYAAIVEALEGVGIRTTEASLRREMKRPQQHLKRTPANASSGREPDASPSPTAKPHATAAVPADAPAPEARGRQVAEAFFNAHPSNPLFRSEESS